MLCPRRRWKNPKHLTPQTGEENGNVRPLSAAYVNTSQTYVNTNRAYVSDAKGEEKELFFFKRESFLHFQIYICKFL